MAEYKMTPEVQKLQKSLMKKRIKEKAATKESKVGFPVVEGSDEDLEYTPVETTIAEGTSQRPMATRMKSSEYETLRMNLKNAMNAYSEDKNSSTEKDLRAAKEALEMFQKENKELLEKEIIPRKKMIKRVME